jgi:hypothetical protein
MTTDVKKRSSKRPIYFHIGQAKAASTFLQKNIFEPHPEIHHLFSRHFKKEFIDFTDHCYGGGEEDFKNKLENLHRTNYTKAKIDMISYEGFLGIFPSVKTQRNLKFIKQAFPESSIILVLRNQLSYLESVWKSYVEMGGTGKFNDFLHNFNKLTNNKYPKYPTGAFLNYDLNIRPGSIFYRLLYDRLISFLDQLFGEEKVHILFFEDLKSNSEKFIINMYKKLEVVTSCRMV